MRISSIVFEICLVKKYAILRRCNYTHDTLILRRYPLKIWVSDGNAYHANFYFILIIEQCVELERCNKKQHENNL